MEPSKIAEIRNKTEDLGLKAFKKVDGFFEDFRKFIDRGNVVELALGVIFGVAFGAVVTSLVTDIFSPVIGLMGTASLVDLFVIMRYGNHNDSAHEVMYPTVSKAKEAGAITLNYGNFFQSIINFFIVTFCLFLFIKLLFVFKKKAPSTDWPCPKCKELVKEGAVRCPHCTAEPIAPSVNLENDGDFLNKTRMRC